MRRDAALRGEVRQSLALVGAFAFLVVAGSAIGVVPPVGVIERIDLDTGYHYR